MGFQKFQKAEKTEVVSPEGHESIQADLQRIGKTSAAELTEAERQEVKPLDKQ